MWNLNVASGDAALIWRGRLFHSLGAVTEKGQSPFEPHSNRHFQNREIEKVLLKKTETDSAVQAHSC